MDHGILDFGIQNTILFGRRMAAWCEVLIAWQLGTVITPYSCSTQAEMPELSLLSRVQ